MKCFLALISSDGHFLTLRLTPNSSHITYAIKSACFGTCSTKGGDLFTIIFMYITRLQSTHINNKVLLALLTCYVISSKLIIV